MKELFSKSVTLLIFALVGVLALAGYVMVQGISPGQGEGQVSQSRGTEASEEGQPAPDFSLERLNGEPFQLSEHRGTVVAINFWATWCHPCRKEIPEFVELQDEMEGEVLFVGVSLDKEGPEEVRSFTEEYGVNYPIVIDDGQVEEKYGPIPGIPTTFLVDREGTVRLQALGQLSTEHLRPVLQTLAEGKQLGTVQPPFRPVDRPLGRE